MSVDAHSRLLVGDPYPVSWEQLHLLLHLPAPTMTAAPDLKDGECVRALRWRAADGERYADTLAHLLRRGWRLSSPDGPLVAHQTATTPEAALAIVARTSVLQRGTPIEICVAGGDARILVAGGLLARVPPHPGIYPPRTLPALVALQPSEEQRIVDTPEELREVVGEGLHQIARWLEAKPSLLEALTAADLPHAVRALAAEVTADGPIPRRVLVDTGENDMLNLDTPSASVTVTAVSAAVWSAVSAKAGTRTGTMLSFPLEGIGQQLRARGTQIAVELLATSRE